MTLRVVTRIVMARRVINRRNPVPTNIAAWLPPRHADLEVDAAPYTSPAPDEIVVKNRALAINPLDWIIQLAGNIAYPWLKHPFVIGSDVAGEVVEIGSAVTRFAIGDRVLGFAVGTDKDSNSSARGAFQQYTVVFERLASPIPAAMEFQDAAVLPLGLSTAACALFQMDQLGLQHPSSSPAPTGKTVLVWGGSTSVGSNAIQLAVAAGFEVVTTASPRNFDYVRSLGASAVFDYASLTVIEDVIASFQGRTLAGTVAVGRGSAERCADIVHRVEGSRTIAMATPNATFERLAETRRALPGILFRVVTSNVALRVKLARRGIRAKFIWGSSLKNNEVSTAVYADFLPGALAEGRYVAAPPAMVVGDGLDSLQLAIDTQRRGVSAQKVVVTL